jgi:hypothetical protein
MRKKRVREQLSNDEFEFIIPEIPAGVTDPIHYIRGYNGANRCKKSIAEITKLWLEHANNST